MGQFARRSLVAWAALAAATLPAAAEERIGRVDRADPRLDRVVSPDASLEVLADGHEWTEGPLWVPSEGWVLFSDIPRNAVYKWEEGEGKELYLKPSGYTGDAPRGGEKGANGLLLGPEGRLVLCQHGDRRIARMEAPLSDPSPRFTSLVGAYHGKRLNSPNDATYAADGALYFTDPPYGLEEGVDDPAKELPFQGVYRLPQGGEPTLLTKALSRPNGIGLSPDGKTLYVANSDPDRAVWMAYDVKDDGTIHNGRVFFDATKWVDQRKGLPDGLAIDRKGRLFATGPGGVLVLAPDGTHLGTIRTTQATSNCAFGDDGSTLYVTADRYLLRIRLRTEGKRFVSSEKAGP